MKKILVLSLVLVFAFSLSALACTPGDPLCSDTTDMKIKINDYCEAEFNTPDEWARLFGNGTDSNIGKPGLYISDGMGFTAPYVKTDLWADVLAAAPSPGDYSYDPETISFGSGVEGAEAFSIDANTKVKVTLSSDFVGWMNAPTLLMVHSSANWDGGKYIPAEEWNGIGNWDEYLAYIANHVDDPVNAQYQGMVTAHNALVNDGKDSFILDFPEDYICHGPLDFTIDGALLIPKASQVASGDYETTVNITVAAVE